MNNYQALEACLVAEKNGLALEESLLLFPYLSAELRPALEAAQAARRLGASKPAEAVIRRYCARSRLRFRTYLQDHKV